MKNLINTLIISCLMSTTLLAQQLPISNLYDQNRMMFNPANTGDQDVPVAMLHHRQQWMGIQGAPMSQIITIQTPLGEYMGVGGMIQNTKTDILRQTSLHLNYAYGVDLALGHRLTFGLGAVYYQNSLDLNNVVVQDQSELSMYATNFNGSSFNMDFGVRYNWDKLEVGISANQLLSNKLNSFSPNDNRFNQFRTHFNGIASYGIVVGESNFIIKPTVLVRYIPQSGTLNDYIVGLDWKNLVWGNLGYRDGNNFIFSAGTWITNNVSLAYSYNYSTEMLSMESFGSHEIALKINLKPKEGEGPYKANERTGELTEREKALMEKSGASKTVIKISRDGFDNNTEQIIIKPGSKMNDNNELEQLKKDTHEINKKIDLLLNSDVSSDKGKEDFLKEIIVLKTRLNELLKFNDPNNVQEVSDEITDIQRKIEELKKKLN